MPYDVIIVGARCAGAPLAMLLARRGARVLLLDRAAFPSDIPHGHFIHRHGPQRLRDWGLLDRIASRTPAISRLVHDIGDFPLRVQDRGRRRMGLRAASDDARPRADRCGGGERGAAASQEALGLRAAVRHQPREATRFIKALMGMTDRASFFNPENLQRLMGARR
jgi:2-polyprenyl-6-methoxyphenol hydroxylase-like FAD-dependent oxidoreductase